MLCEVRVLICFVLIYFLDFSRKYLTYSSVEICECLKLFTGSKTYEMYGSQ